MYLRNKKTGEVVDWSFVGPTAIKEYEGEDVLLERERYESIEEFVSEWEDYVPKEPLIKDEKIRKAVRAFSEAIQEKKHILVIKDCGFGRAEFSNGANYWIKLPLDEETMDALEDRTYYTIAELCGEEEK